MRNIAYIKKEKIKMILMLASSSFMLLLITLYFPAVGRMVSKTPPDAINGKAINVITLSPDEALQIPFRPEMEILTEASFYLLHIPEEEDGDFLVVIKDKAGQVLFEADKPLSELPIPEQFSRIPIGVTLDTEDTYICEVRYTGQSPDPGVRLVLMDEKQPWYTPGAIHDSGTIIDDAILMNLIFFSRHRLFMLICKLILMFITACCVIFSSVKLCGGNAS